jgi:hypothetical protein
MLLFTTFQQTWRYREKTKYIRDSIRGSTRDSTRDSTRGSTRDGIPLLFLSKILKLNLIDARPHDVSQVSLGV